MLKSEFQRKGILLNPKTGILDLCKIPPLPREILQPLVAISEGGLWAFGGYSLTERCISPLLFHCVLAGDLTWKLVSSSPFGGRFGGMLVLEGGSLIVLNGVSAIPGDPESLIFLYSLVSRSWSKTSVSLPDPGTNTPAMRNGDWLFITGAASPETVLQLHLPTLVSSKLS